MPKSQAVLFCASILLLTSAPGVWASGEVEKSREFFKKAADTLLQKSQAAANGGVSPAPSEGCIVALSAPALLQRYAEALQTLSVLTEETSRLDIFLERLAGGDTNAPAWVVSFVRETALAMAVRTRSSPAQVEGSAALQRYALKIRRSGFYLLFLRHSITPVFSSFMALLERQAHSALEPNPAPIQGDYFQKAWLAFLIREFVEPSSAPHPTS